jgi:hypothetical protein
MATYTYKGFEVVYEIEKVAPEGNLYKADAHVIPKDDCNNLDVLTRFHTEFPTRTGVQKEIKKLIQNYIDFEWRKLTEMQEST